MPTVKETFDNMASRFRADKAAGVNATIQYDITGDQGGTWSAVIKDGHVGQAQAQGRHGARHEGGEPLPGLAAPAAAPAQAFEHRSGTDSARGG